MQVVLHVAMDVVNQELLELLKTLLSRNAEIPSFPCARVGMQSRRASVTSHYS